jgi:hypothetical protein
VAEQHGRLAGDGLPDQLLGQPLRRHR